MQKNIKAKVGDKIILKEINCNCSLCISFKGKLCEVIDYCYDKIYVKIGNDYLDFCDDEYCKYIIINKDNSIKCRKIK